MICSSRSALPSCEPASASTTSADASADTVDGCTAYGTPFWMAYVANSLVTVAWALLYRYADFVTLLGGTERDLGWILGLGMIGSLVMRFALGTGIDQYGPRRLWLGSQVLFALTCFAHLAVSSHAGIAIYLLRIALLSSVAGIYGSSITFISGRVSMVRMAELVGMLGTSGFMGIVVGTVLGDLFCGTKTIERWQIDLLFIAAGSMALVATGFVWLATGGLPAPRPRRRRPPVISLLWRYQPGTVLVVGVAAGAALALPATFLRTFGAELNIPRMWLFFFVYAGVAIVTRVLTRRMPEQIGLTPMILLGLGALVVAEVSFLMVRSEWQLIVPAISYGVAHAIVFPTITAAGTSTFPYRYRGLGTMVILATFDVGILLGAPLVGEILHFSSAVGLPRYPTMFATMAALLGIVGVMYALTCRTARLQTQRVRPPHRRRLPQEQPALARSGGQS
jgi:MFS family permease